MQLVADAVWKSPEEPWFFEVISTHSDLTNYVWARMGSNEKLVAKILRGIKMRTPQSLFDEFSAALQFPYYFGENWDAFDECLSDLDWLFGDAYLLAITDAEEILAECQPEQFEILLRILCRLCAEWSGAVHDFPKSTRVSKPFHVIFHSIPENAHLLDGKFNAIAWRPVKATI